MEFSHTRYKNVVASCAIRSFQEQASLHLNLMHSDYFSKLTPSDFKKYHLGMDGLVAQILTYRYFSGTIMKKLTAVAEGLIRKKYQLSKSVRLVRHPCFNIRYSYPEMYLTPQHKKALLDTQPHCDMSWDLPQFSLWLPLVTINHQSGGICFFQSDDPAQSSQSSHPLNHAYNYQDYLKRAKQIDPILKNQCLLPNMHPGDMVLFDSKTRHGGLKSITRHRISLDFRMVTDSDLKKCSKRTQSVFHQVNHNFDLSRACNLISLGDFKGAARILASLKNSRKNFPEQLIMSLHQSQTHPDLFKKKKLLDWRKEYNWIQNS